MRSKLFFLTICISSAIYSPGQNNDGVLFMLDKKIKGPVKIYYERKGDDNPKMITLSGYRYFTVDLNDSIFFELHNEEGTYEFVIYHDDVQITDSFLLDIKKNHFEKLFLAIKNFEIKNGDTINSLLLIIW